MEASWKKCEIPDQKSPMPLFYKGLRDCVSPDLRKEVVFLLKNYQSVLK